MKYHINDVVKVNVESIKDKQKRISIKPQKNSVLEEMNFTIIDVNERLQSYRILIHQDMVGWIISKFHTKHYNVSPELIGRKFYDIPESLILGLVSPKKINEK